MIRKTINTIKKNPIILIGYGIMVFVPIIIDIAFQHFTFPDWLTNANNFVNVSAIDDKARYRRLVINTIELLLASTFITIPLLRYTTEIIENIDTRNWYKRALKKYWWRWIVYYLIIIIMCMIVVISMIILSYISILITYTIGILIFALFMLYCLLGRFLVVIENEFEQGLRNIFIIPMKFALKYLLLLVLVAGIVNLLTWLGRMDLFLNNLYLASLLSIVLGIITWISTAFTNTYCVYSYIYYRDLNDEQDDEQDDEDDGDDENDQDDYVLEQSFAEKIRNRFIYK